MPDATGSRAMSKKPKRLLERVTLLGSCAQLRLDVPVGITVAEARQRVEESWGWAAGRLLFFAADSALIWDDDYQLVGGSIVVGRAPLPLTVVFRLIAVTSRLVNHKVPLLVPGGALATAKNACASLGRHLGIPGSELLEVVLLEAKEQPAALEDEENLEALQLRSAIIRFRRPAQRMVLELLKMRLLWPLGKQGCRPPPQDSWSISVPDLGDSALETLEATQQVLRCAASEAQDLVFHATEDAYRWRVELQRPLPAQGEMVEFVVTFPAEYPLKPVRLEGSLLLDGQEVPMDQIFSGDRWSPANTVYCALGEVVDFMMLHRTEEEVGDGKPRIPRLPLS
ncbi:unnamed protein product [Durusdinium trenchii]|uniref:UBC core domain-containing protein n=2 Tax=Durusdinium trenchii TaxID=1381693 RepID=A0ABP0KHX5_9DINO